MKHGIKKAVYAGSFDLVTNGHKWVIGKGAEAAEVLVVATGTNPTKKYTFADDERLEMLKDVVKNYPNVEVGNLGNKYLVNYARSVGATHIIRGIRNEDDYRLEVAFMQYNKDIAPEIDTVFFMPPGDLAKISSSSVKNLIIPEGWERVIEKYIPSSVFEKTLEKFEIYRWADLCKKLGARNDEIIQDVYNKLAKRYSEPHRVYHTFSHIGKGFCDLDEFKDTGYLSEEELDMVEFAWPFHDGVYVFISDDNEEKSAELALQAAKEIDLQSSLGERVYNCILATKPGAEPRDRCSKVMRDADLSILGRPENEFDEYEKKIESEYVEQGGVPKDSFRGGRIAFLTIMQRKENIYSTKFFREKYQKQAKENIRRSLARLEAV